MESPSTSVMKASIMAAPRLGPLAPYPGRPRCRCYRACTGARPSRSPGGRRACSRTSPCIPGGPPSGLPGRRAPHSRRPESGPTWTAASSASAWEPVPRLPSVPPCSCDEGHAPLDLVPGLGLGDLPVVDAERPGLPGVHAPEALRAISRVGHTDPVHFLLCHLSLLGGRPYPNATRSPCQEGSKALSGRGVITV